jgi:putative sterol carrier protein
MAFTSIEEILAGLSQIEPAKIQGINGVMQFEFSGEGGGTWTLTLGDGKIKLEEGEAQSPNVTFAMDAQDFVAIANGELNAVSAFMQGKVKVSGDMALAMRLQSLLT